MATSPTAVDPKRLKRALDTYDTRTQAALAVLARHVGLNAASEQARFAWWRRCLRVDEEPAHAGNPWVSFAARMGFALPPMFELVGSFRQGRLAGFGYLHEGNLRASVGTRLAEQAEAAVRLCLEGGLGEQEAGAFGQAFRTAFPNVNRLEAAKEAQPLLLGVVPRAAGLELRAYFSTPLYPDSDHRQRAIAILQQQGLLDAESAYDALAELPATGSFHGVGIDFAGSVPRRAKLYARVARGELEPALRQLATRLSASSNDTETLLEFLRDLEPPSFTETAELGVGLRHDAPPTLKLTLFHTDSPGAASAEAHVGERLRAWGHAAEPFADALAALRRGVSEPTTIGHALHAIGMEVPSERPPKINVYLRPVL